MRKFFGTTRALPCAGQSTSPSNALSVWSRPFTVSGQHKQAQLLKINLVSPTVSPKTMLELEQEIRRIYKNSLFIWTKPTVRSISSHFDDCIYPGHNFSSITDDRGEIAGSMSKRPDTRLLIGERKRVPDRRFKNQSGTTRLFTPCYPSVQEELIQWVKHATNAPQYPLFVHIIPLVPSLHLNIASYRDNIEILKHLNEPYSLFSFVHPHDSDRYIRAGNCNAATEGSIFGINSTSIQDLSCQEAAMKMVSRLLKPQQDYLKAAEDLGLTQGIETSPIPEDLYHSSFTC